MNKPNQLKCVELMKQLQSVMIVVMKFREGKCRPLTHYKGDVNMFLNDFVALKSIKNNRLEEAIINNDDVKVMEIISDRYTEEISLNMIRFEKIDMNVIRSKAHYYKKNLKEFMCFI